MTPLAAYLAKQLVTRPKHREPYWAEPENANPAPMTWIEMRTRQGRFGTFIGDCGDGRALVLGFSEDHFAPIGEIGLNSEFIYTSKPEKRSDWASGSGANDD